jgi:DASH complex subunit ASK1
VFDILGVIANEMSRPNSSVQRNLTLTEELEKLEQSITLTLQGADQQTKGSERT